MAKKILIIEDYKATAEMLSRMLEMNGYEAISALDGESGLKKAALERPDLILLDIMLPEKSGIEVCKELKSGPRTKNIPVVMVTVKVEEEDVQKGKQAGAVDYVFKPFDPDKLMETIQKYI